MSVGNGTVGRPQPKELYRSRLGIIVNPVASVLTVGCLYHLVRMANEALGFLFLELFGFFSVPSFIFLPCCRGELLGPPSNTFFCVVVCDKPTYSQCSSSPPNEGALDMFAPRRSCRWVVSSAFLFVVKAKRAGSSVETSITSKQRSPFCYRFLHFLFHYLRDNFATQKEEPALLHSEIIITLLMDAGTLGLFLSGSVAFGQRDYVNDSAVPNRGLPRDRKTMRGSLWQLKQRTKCAFSKE